MIGRAHPLISGEVARHDAAMSTREPARLDLYNGLVELLGENRAETLMTYLPTNDPAGFVTRADLSSSLAEFTARLEGCFDRLEQRFDRLEQRFDRLFLTVVAGLFVMVASVIATSL